MLPFAVILILILPLTSCGWFVKSLGINTDCERYAEELDFATSDRILRGAWRGSVADVPAPGDVLTLHLDLTATHLEPSRYEIEGSFALEGEQPAMITGTVAGGCTERYSVHTATTGAPSTDPSPVGGMPPNANPLTVDSIPPPASLDAEVRDAAGTIRWRVTAQWLLFGEDSFALTVESVADTDVRGDAILERVEAP